MNISEIECNMDRFVIEISVKKSIGGHDLQPGDRLVIDPAARPKFGDVVLLKGQRRLSIWPVDTEIVGTAIERRRALGRLS